MKSEIIDISRLHELRAYEEEGVCRALRGQRRHRDTETRRYNIRLKLTQEAQEAPGRLRAASQTACFKKAWF